MILKIHTTEYKPENAASRVRKLHLENPSGCHFMATWKRIGCEWKGAMTYPLFRFPIIQLRDWDYQDLFEIMMLSLRLAESEITARISLLSGIEGMTPWRPLAIADDFVAFDVLSSDGVTRCEVAARVKAFQETFGLECFPSLFGGYWVGPRRRSFAIV